MEHAGDVVGEAHQVDVRGTDVGDLDFRLNGLFPVGGSFALLVFSTLPSTTARSREAIVRVPSVEAPVRGRTV